MMGRRPGGKNKPKAERLEQVESVTETVTPLTEEEKQAEQARQLAELQAEHAVEAGEQSDEPRRRRRKRKQIEPEIDPVEQEKILQAKASFSTFVNAILDMWVPRAANPIPLTEAERKMTADATSAMVEKYFPMLGGYDVELAFVAMLGIVIVPRIIRKKNATDGNTHIRENGIGKNDARPEIHSEA